MGYWPLDGYAYDRSEKAATEIANTPVYGYSSFTANYKLEDLVDSKNAYNLTNDNSVGFVSGLFGNCADFGTANTNKRLYVNNSQGITGSAATIAIRFKVRTEPGTGVFYCLTQKSFSGAFGKYQIAYYDSAGVKRLYFARIKNNVGGQAVDVAVTALGTNTWNTLVMTYDGTNIKGYLNGELLGTAAASGSGSGGTSNYFSLGAGFNDNSGIAWESHASVYIDDVGLATSALNQDEIRWFSGKVGNHGTVTGALPIPAQNPAIPASLAYKFDGASRIALGNVLNVQGAITVIAWIYVTNATAQQGIISRGNGSNGDNTQYHLDIESNTVRFYIRNTGLTYYIASKAIPNNKWCQVIGTWAGGANPVQIYVNALRGTDSANFTGTQLTGSVLNFGSSLNAGGYFTGKLQDLAILNKWFSGKEVNAIHTQTKFKYDFRNILVAIGTVFTQACSETVSITSSLLRTPGKLITNSIQVFAQITRRKSMTIANIVTVSDVLSYITSKFRMFSEAIAVTQNFASRITAKMLKETLVVTQSISKGLVAFKSFLESIVVHNTVDQLKLYAKNLLETLTITDHFSRRIYKKLKEAITIVQFISKLRSLSRIERVYITANLAKFRIRYLTLTETISFLDKLVTRFNGLLTAWGRSARDRFTWGRSNRDKGDWTRGQKGK